MTSREQDNEIARLAREHGSVAIRDGFLDHHVDATVQGGQCFTITEDGHPTEVGPNHSISWTKENT